MNSGFLVNLETINVTKLQVLWRPFMILMRLFGLAFTNEPPWTLLKLYALVRVVLSWCLLAIHFYTVLFTAYYQISFDVNVRSMKELTIALHMIRVSLKSSALFLAFHRADCMQRVFQLWSTITLPCEVVQRLEVTVHSLTKVAVVVTVIIFAISEIAETITWISDGYDTTLLGPYLIIACIDCISGLFCWLMVSTMKALFSGVNQCFLRSNRNSQLPLENLCLIFYTAVDIVSAASDSLSVVFGAHLLSNFLQCCINTYILVFDSTNKTVDFSLTVYWSFLAFCRFWFVFWGAANVNSEVHSLLNYVHQLPVENLKISEVVKGLFLQNRLSSQGIGFSMFGVQIITKGTLPVLLSGYVTYVFLLAQFHLGQNTPHFHCYSLRTPPSNSDGGTLY